MIQIITHVVAFIMGFGSAVFLLLWSAEAKDGNTDYKRRR